MRALLINPWTYDFAAFDMWGRPIGLLYIAAVLKKSGFDIDYLDCLDRLHPLAIDVRGKDKPWGTGKYYAEEIRKPEPIKWMKRKFKRYGIPIDRVESYLEKTEKPDIIFLTSRMTYWYPAVRDMAELCRKYFPETKLILGGTYATLMPEHAMNVVRPDYLIRGEGEMQLQDILEKIFGHKIKLTLPDPDNLDSYPFPSQNYYKRNHYGVMMTSRGCPMKCSYCASKLLIKKFRRRSVDSAIEEIHYLKETLDPQNIAFYDDALLYKPEEFFKPFMRKYLEHQYHDLHFHLPNGISCRDIDEEMAELIKAAQFETLRLSLETTNIDRLKAYQRENKPNDFIRAIRALKKAGFSKESLGVYLLAGLPGQTPQEVDDTLKYVTDEGGDPRIAEYSPIPGTPLWNEALKGAKENIENEPLYHNCSVYFYLVDTINHDTINILRRKYRSPIS